MTQEQRRNFHNFQPGTKRVQPLTDILCSALCCHSNKTRALIANPPNSAQWEGTPCSKGQTDTWPL